MIQDEKAPGEVLAEAQQQDPEFGLDSLALPSVFSNMVLFTGLAEDGVVRLAFGTIVNQITNWHCVVTLPIHRAMALNQMLNRMFSPENMGRPPGAKNN